MRLPLAMEYGKLLKLIEERKRLGEDIEAQIEQAAIIFIDLSGSTQYKYRKGIVIGVEKVLNFNLEASKIIRNKFKNLKDEAVYYEICKYIGDEVMVYVKGKDALKSAVSTAIDIQNYFKDINKMKNDELEKFKVKIGIDFGEVLFAQFNKFLPRDPYGLIVDRAARIISLAKPYQILISEDAGKMLNGGFELSIVNYKEFKGINKRVGVQEVIWDGKPFGIAIEEPSTISIIDSSPATVQNFIEERNLIEESDRIDLCLYSAETFMRNYANHLQDPNLSGKIFRILIKTRDKYKDHHIISSIKDIDDIININPHNTFCVRFYDQEPLLRSYIFYKHNQKKDGLLGIYRYVPGRRVPFVGAEDNILIHTKGESEFEKNLTALYESRFQYMWERFSTPRAIIFDLDGVLIDSMPFYYVAWKSAFSELNIDITEEEIYQREGQKRESIACEIFKKYAKKDPDTHTIKLIVKRKEEEFNSIFEVRPIPGAIKLLNDLKAKKIKLGLVTGSIKPEERLKTHCEFLKLFDTIITGNDTKKGKPYPDPYQKAIKDLNISEENAYAIENSPLGVKSAVSAGITCFAVKTSTFISSEVLLNAGASIVYDDFDKLRKHLIWADINMHLHDFIKIFL